MTTDLRSRRFRSVHLGAPSGPRLPAAVCPSLLFERPSNPFPTPSPGCQRCSSLGECAKPGSLDYPEAPKPR